MEYHPGDYPVTKDKSLGHRVRMDDFLDACYEYYGELSARSMAHLELDVLDLEEALIDLADAIELETSLEPTKADELPRLLKYRASQRAVIEQAEAPEPVLPPIKEPPAPSWAATLASLNGKVSAAAQR